MPYAACRGNSVHGRIKLTSDNSTVKLEYVSCVNCKSTKLFKRASGIIPEPSKLPPVHLSFHNSPSYSRRRRACDILAYLPDAIKITESTADVTCCNCLKSKEFKSRVETVQEAADPKE